MKSLLMPLLLSFQLYATPISHPIVHKDPERENIELIFKQKYDLDSLKINFEILPKDDSSKILGVYCSWNDSLKLNYYEIMRVTANSSLNSDTLLAHVMGHELTHYRVDKLREKLGLRSEMDNKSSRDLIMNYFGLLFANEKNSYYSYLIFPNFVRENIFDLTNITLDKMVNEGISLCYEYPGIEPIAVSWPVSISDIQNNDQYERCIYYVGMKLMYPILSIYGEKGLEYVLKNMPKYDDFSKLPEYQNRILKELSEQK